MKDTKAVLYVCPNCNSTFNYVPSECQFCGRISKTNADRIRAMSDEELARFISLDDEHEYGGILGWLKQEVE